MKLFLLFLAILISQLGCQGSRSSPDDIRKKLCSASPAAYDAMVASCQKVADEKKRSECLTAAEIARAAMLATCNVTSSLHRKFPQTVEARHDLTRNVAFHKLE